MPIKIGDRFGRLTVIKKLPSITYGRNTKSKKSNWLCQCDCGNTKEANSSLLSAGLRSCGCLQKENFERMQVDITGQRSGRLVALKKTGKKEHGGYTWLCQCDCGNKVELRIDSFKKNKSCGCLNKEVILKTAPKKLEATQVNDTNIGAVLKNGVPKTNTSGYVGVSWHKALKKWYAYINFRKKRYSLGCYDSAEEASKVREQKRLELIEEYENEFGKMEVARRKR